MKKSIACSLMLSILFSVGCATTTGLPAQTTTSGFDGTKFVSMSNHGMACYMRMICPTAGFSWNTKAPNLALLKIGVLAPSAAKDAYYSIRSVSLNVDGKIIELDGSTKETDFKNDDINKTSIKDFVVPLELLRAIEASSKTMVRIDTNDGLMEDLIIGDGKDSKAYHALKRFLVAVEEAKKQ